MVSVHSISACATDTVTALHALEQEAAALDVAADFLCVFYDEIHDDQLIHDFLAARFPGVPVLGGTSYRGTMTDKGMSGDASISIFLIADPDGEYGVGLVEFAGDAASAAERALRLALEQAGCVGELPALIWLYQAPGHEEEVIAGLHRIVGDRCPIIGGTAADRGIAGRWRQLGPEGYMKNGVAVGALFPSGEVSIAFQGGYEPTGQSGVITQIANADLTDPARTSEVGAESAGTSNYGRAILTIDGEPAAAVYNHWLGGALDHKQIGDSLAADTTMCPLGIDAGKIGGITQYLVIHPNRLLENGALSTFANIKEGVRVFSMRGDPERLVERAGKAAALAVAGLPGGAKNFAGGLVSYCHGNRLAIGEQKIDQVTMALSESFAGMPFVGCFTFGEQGQMLGYNTHGNLMISVVAFGR
ncbi:MAG: FIST C-terminal domain-containing protein [Azonexus sp.]|jgi:hypothetical protein|nr:FIST C-terminal domain-containing protein [Azonexus sp.]